MTRIRFWRSATLASSAGGVALSALAGLPRCGRNDSPTPATKVVPGTCRNLLDGVEQPCTACGASGAPRKDGSAGHDRRWTPGSGGRRPATFSPGRRRPRHLRLRLLHGRRVRRPADPDGLRIRVGRPVSRRSADRGHPSRRPRRRDRRAGHRDPGAQLLLRRAPGLPAGRRAVARRAREGGPGCGRRRPRSRDRPRLDRPPLRDRRGRPRARARRRDVPVDLAGRAGHLRQRAGRADAADAAASPSSAASPGRTSPGCSASASTRSCARRRTARGSSA